MVVLDQDAAVSLEEPLRYMALQGDTVHVALEEGPAGAEHPRLRALERRFSSISFGRAPASRGSSRHALATTIRGCLDVCRVSDMPVEEREPLEAPDDLPRAARLLSASGALGVPRLRRLIHNLRDVERVLPLDPVIVEFLRKQEPALLIVAPARGAASSQADYLRAARAAGIATFCGATTWSDFTERGEVHELPDCVGVWNRDQRRHAIERQGMPPQRTTVIGAYGVERFVDDSLRAPDPSRRVILFAGGVAIDAESEISLFRKWLDMLRAHSEPHLCGATVWVRSHWRNAATWRAASIASVRVLDSASTDDSSHDEALVSILRAVDAVVVLDTGLVPPAAAQGIPAFALFSEALRAGQRDLAAFQRGHTVSEWPSFAHTLDEHFQQLTSSLSNRGASAAVPRAAARAWVRPHGAVLSPGFITATRVVSEVVGSRRPPVLVPPVSRPVRAALTGIGAILRATGAAQPPRRVRQHAPEAHVRVLVVTPSHAHLSQHQPLLSQLVQQGHRVAVAFSARREQSIERERLDHQVSGAAMLGVLPRRTGLWRPISDALTGLVAAVRFLELHAGPVDAPWRLRLLKSVLPKGLRRLDRRSGMQTPVVRRALRALTWLERAVPVSVPVADVLSSERPDVVVVLPALDAVGAIESSFQQVEVVHAARAAGIPSVVSAGGSELPINSPLLCAGPDVALFWNMSQCDEAVALHGLRAEQVGVSGAVLADYVLDDGFVLDEASFRHQAGIPVGQPYALFVGSSELFADSVAESAFVHSWVSSLRASEVSALQGLIVVVRPMSHSEAWYKNDFSGLGGVVVYPPRRDRARTADALLMRESVKYATVTISTNSTALAMACASGCPAIVAVADGSRRKVSGAAQFRDRRLDDQGGMRFAGGPVELVQQVHEVIGARPERARHADGWIDAVLRPQGVSASTEMVRRIEDAARARPETSRRTPVRDVCLRPFLLAAAGIVELAGVVDGRIGSAASPPRARKPPQRHNAVAKRSHSLSGRLRKWPGALAHGLRRARYYLGTLRRNFSGDTIVKGPKERR
jgi:hypothetical protein